MITESLIAEQSKQLKGRPLATNALNRVMAYLPDSYKRGYNPRGFPAIVTDTVKEHPKGVAYTRANENKIFFNTPYLNTLEKKFDLIYRRVRHHNPELKDAKISKQLKIFLEEMMSAIFANIMVHELTHIRQYNIAVVGRELKYALSKQDKRDVQTYMSVLMQTAKGMETEATAEQLEELDNTTRPQIKRILSKLSDVLGSDKSSAIKYISDSVNKIVEEVYNSTFRYLDANILADQIKDFDETHPRIVPTDAQREKAALEKGLHKDAYKRRSSLIY